MITSKTQACIFLRLRWLSLEHSQSFLYEQIAGRRKKRQKKLANC